MIDCCHYSAEVVMLNFSFGSHGFGGGGSGGYGRDGRGGGGRGGGGGSSLGNGLRKPTWDLTKLPRFEKHFYHEHPTTSQRTIVS